VTEEQKVFTQTRSHVESSSSYHLFLCPKKALGMPVRMRSPPRTPNPGSSLVSSRIGAGELVSVGEVVEVVEVGVPVEEESGYVLVTGNTEDI
jgi:hypothetical protein